MSVYRFKVAFEDSEEINREIEIKSTQSFEDFHFIILKSIAFDKEHTASFFISDDYWRKGEEIKLDVDEKENEKRTRKGLPASRLMKKCKIVSLIDDPHQKFVYQYDPQVAWTLLIELLKISPDNDNIEYPRVTKTVEDAPKQYPDKILLDTIAYDEDEDADETKLETDDEAYTNAKDEDDLKHLESEEGEEVEEEILEEGDQEEPEEDEPSHEEFEEN